ncbi:TetR/AcrR family transcriptional regulator [Desulfobulbus rhabdoformis]|jgi:TetR/AcrR family transcriptional repressor of nem operon|uniref:TetR/AcrR family transcriptional regulator n=1 Tax=Desulfobulbus rhabdoformis TaxID=34032 RepID=UPI001965993B|nr:TetR/AcrR family transcriptional regulator [Desulfobulbus rhabdoformis]MBM9614373.1 TetR/AcrR family transcriptional regulator [Desulfobulbus rhabdoformis]
MKRRDENKQHIIRKGLKALYQKGYNATGVQEIANAAEIPKGSFYNYFKNKEDFAVEAMRLFTERELEMMSQVLLDDNLPPLERIKQLYRNKIEYLSSKGAFSLGCFLCNITLEMADVSETISIEAARCFKREYAPLLTCLEQAQEEGSLTASTNLDRLVSLIRNCWLGALVIMKANKSAQPLDEFQVLLDEMLKNASIS